MRWSPNYYLKGTTWTQPSWRKERPSRRVFAPVSACLSFDGKTWEPIEPAVLVGMRYDGRTWEPVDEDHDRREWDSICRAFLSTKLVKQLDSNGSSFVERAPRIIDGQAALIERVRVLIADTMMSAGELADEIEEVLDSLANEPQTGQPNRPPK